MVGKDKKTNSAEVRNLLRQNERWTVTVRHEECPDVIMDEYYLYVLDFIYGDREQQKKNGLSKPRKKQYVGSEEHLKINGENVSCKIVIPSKKLDGVLGEIRYEQDFGLVIDDLKLDKKKNEDTFIRITDGCELTIGEFTLTFKKDNSVLNYILEKHGNIEVKSENAEENDASSKKTEKNSGKKGNVKSLLRKFLGFLIEQLK